MSILGHHVVRREDPAFLTGSATYVGDLDLPDGVELVYVRSTVAHGGLLDVDVSEARLAPGVVGVFVAGDLDQPERIPTVLPAIPDAMGAPMLARDVVRYVGEPIVAVVAETRAQAVDAAELVVVDYDVRPSLMDPESALDDEIVLHPEVGTNIVGRFGNDRRADLGGCEVVVRERIVHQRLTAAPIEPRAGAAFWSDDGRLIHWSACQGAHPTRAMLTRIYGLDPDQVRVVVPDVGGSFGAKSRTYADELALGFYARAVGRPVRWSETRTENVMCMPHGRGQIQDAALGGTRDGRITAYQLDIVQDTGAYPLIGAVLANMTFRMACGTYDIADVGVSATSVVTTAAPITAYRGAGRPEATVAVERMIDRYAAEIGMDPAEVRRINLIDRFTEPVTTGVGTSYDVGDYPEALRLALDAVGYDDRRAEQADRRAAGTTTLLGIGIGMYVEITAGNGSPEYGRIELTTDGRFRAVTGATTFGQGHETTWATVVADRLGVEPERIDVVSGDTDLVARGGLTVGSRSVQTAGAALVNAGAALVDRARETAASLLEAAIEDVRFEPERGVFSVAGTPTAIVTWDQIADRAGGLAGEEDFAPEMATFPSGCHVAVVEVDAATGGATVVRLVAVDDAGTIVNPLLADGQIHGGIAQGIAQVLFEAIEYDPDGNLVTASFMDYLVPSAADLPSCELVPLATPTWVNPLGAKGVGESGTIGAIPAVYNAVIDAVGHLGIRHLETPLTPQRLWSAIDAARG